MKMANRTAPVELQRVRKQYGNVAAVEEVSITIDAGTLVTLLGPSGCGKTTTLRMIAGFVPPSAGTIEMDGRQISSPSSVVPPEKRRMSMIFQSYAIWTNMTVGENVGFGLQVRKLSRAEIDRKVDAILDVVQMRNLKGRYPAELSGGQQQRVALARALVFSPKVLLLDEPLSNLDAQLREEMRRELKALQRRVNVTVIFVTHDQIEALSLSDRIAIMKFGVLEQVGTPEEVYYKPATPFVRDFLGKTFLLPGKVAGVSDQQVEVEVQGVGTAALTLQRSNVISSGNGFPKVGQSAMVAIRPEKISLSDRVSEGQPNVVEGTLRAMLFLGDRYEYTVTLGGETRVIVSPEARQLKQGGKVFLDLKPDGMTLWPRDG